MVDFVIVAITAYLLGSFNFAIIVSKLLLKSDIRSHGSGNAGATNALRTMGVKKSLFVIAGDIAKCAIAVTIGYMLMGDLGRLIGGLFVMIGHIFPLYFDFKGGKGVLTGATMLFFFDIRVALIAIGLFAIVFYFTRFVSLGSMIGAASFPITTLIFYDDTTIRLLALFMALAVIVMHRANIRRLIAGKEKKFKVKK